MFVGNFLVFRFGQFVVSLLDTKSYYFLVIFLFNVDVVDLFPDLHHPVVRLPAVVDVGHGGGDPRRQAVRGRRDPVHLAPDPEAADRGYDRRGAGPEHLQQAAAGVGRQDLRQGDGPLGDGQVGPGGAQFLPEEGQL